MPAKPKKKNGRPSKFTDVSPRIPLLARNGFTDVQIAETLAISEDTLTKWKTKYPDFFLSLNDWKHAADKDVVRSLYERAKGYSHPEAKVFCNKDGEITTYEVIRHYPPDPTSCIFWLKNRDKKNWRDKQEVEHSGEVSQKSLTELFTGIPQLIQLLHDRLASPGVGQKLIEGG